MKDKFSEKMSIANNYFENKLDIIKSVEEVIEMNKEDLETWKENKLKETLVYSKENSKFYKEKFKELTLDDSFFQQSDFMNKIPFTYKKEITEQYPFGLLSDDISNIVRYGESSGTTDSPISSYYTREDWIANNATVAKLLTKILNKDDIVAIIVPYELALVGQDLDRAIEMIGCTTIAIGSLTKSISIERAIMMLKSLGVTTIICSPTRLLFLAEEAMKMGLTPSKDFKVTKLLCPGEGTSKVKIKHIEEIWGAYTYPMYGMTETNTLAMPCENQALHLVENKAYFEIVDPVTNENIGYNERGELVVTSFVKGMPLIRYKTGDLCTIVNETCECNGCARKIIHHGRIQDFITINNVHYQILDLEEVIIGISKTNFYTLRILDNNRLEIGLVLDEEECTCVSDKLRKAFLDNFKIKIMVKSTSMDEISKVIKISTKPSIKSILLT